MLYHFSLTADSKGDSKALVLLPNGLDMKNLVNTGGDRFALWQSDIALQKLETCVSLLIERTARTPDFESHGGYVPMNAVEMRNLFGVRFPVLKALVDLGVFEENPCYSAGRFSKSYRLFNSYNTARTRLHQTNAKSLKACHGADEAKTKAVIRNNSTRAFIYDNLHRLSVPSEVLKNAEERTYDSPAQQAAWLCTLRDLTQKTHWMRSSEKSGRLFHTITSCPRDIRSSLLLDGEEVAEVDLANAQPFFLLSLYPKDHPERTRFARIVSEGRFYEALFEALPATDRRQWGSTLKGWNTPGTDYRDRFKKYAMQHVLYSGLCPDKMRAVFEVLGWRNGLDCGWLAGELAKRRETQDGASALCCEMQKRETELILDTIFPQIQATLPGCRAISVHDGILCQKRFADLVQQIVKQYAENAYDVRPQVRIKKTSDTTFAAVVAKV